MNEETNQQPEQVPQVSVSPGISRTVIEPSAEFKQALQSQQIEPAVLQEDVASPPDSQPTPTASHPYLGVSASQLGMNGPSKEKFFSNPKRMIAGLVITLLAISIAFAILLATHIIVLSEFKTIHFTNSKGTNYSLNFYTNYKVSTLTGTKSPVLLSKVSKDGKFPLELTITTSDASGYSRLENCANFTKVFDVKNDKLGQNIAVCDALNGKGGGLVIYIAGFLKDDHLQTMTFTQDTNGADTSSQAAAQKSLAKFGMTPYQNDIKKIISSIDVQ